jgi:plastocyanin
MDARSLIVVGIIAGLTAHAPPRARQLPGRSGEARVTVQLFKFRPDTLVVSPGATVAWVDQDEIEHTVTAGTPERRPRGSMAFTGTLASRGSTFQRTFTREGTYPYFCERHQFMRGVIRVTRTGASK